MRISDWSSDVCSSDLTQPNTEIATEFLSMAASGQVREAFARHVADSFTHHNAYFPGARESLLIAMEQRAASEDRKSVVQGTSVSARVDIVGRRLIKKTKTIHQN